MTEWLYDTVAGIALAAFIIGVIHMGRDKNKGDK